MDICVCNPPVQVGAGDNAPFGFKAQYLNEPSMPIVFGSAYSGAEMWWHYPYDAQQYIEVRHYDGTISRYEFVTDAELVRATDGLAGQWWRLVWVRDPYDNQTTYVYNSADRLAEVQYPNGVTAHWDWTPTWVTNYGNGHSAVEVTYSANGQALANLGWSIVFENVYTQGRLFKWFEGRPRYRFSQLHHHISDAGIGQLYDTSTLTTARHVTEFVYGATTNATADDVSYVRNYWWPNTLVPGPADDAIYPRAETVSTTYHPDGRVASQTLSQLGLTTTYTYSGVATYPHTLPANVTLSSMTITGPYGGQEVREYDPETGRTYRTIIEPGPNGRPRAVEGDFGITGYPHASEVERLQIDRIYDATCVCEKPIRVEIGGIDSAGAWLSAPRVTRFEYDATTSLLKKQWSPNPSTATGAPAEVVTEYQYHSEPGIWSPRWIKKEIAPDGSEVDYSYSNPLARASADHGMMQGQVRRTFKAVDYATGPTTTQTADVSDVTVMNVPGNPAMAPLAYSGPASGFPRGQPRSTVDGDGIDTIYQYDSSHGHLATAYRTNGSGNIVQNSWTLDSWGRLTGFTTNVGSARACSWIVTQDALHRTISQSCQTIANMESRFFYDKWGNLAVSEQKSRASDGGAPHRHGAAPGAREWVRAEKHFQHWRLIESRVDRRPLDEGTGTPMSGTNPLMAVTLYDYGDHVIRVTQPNGAVRETVFDGFGTPFKTTLFETDAPGAPSLEVSRVYVNEWMEPTAVVAGQPGGGQYRWSTVERNAAGAVVATVEPVGDPIPGYTGSLGGGRHEFEIDSLGRQTQHRTLDGTTIVRKSTVTYDQLSRVMHRAAHLLDGTGATTGESWSRTAFKTGKISQVDWAQQVEGPQMAYTYDDLGRVESIHDDQGVGGAAGNKTDYTYTPGTDFVEHVERTLLNAGSAATTYETSYVTDALGRVVEVREAPATSIERVHQYAFDSLGRVDRYVDPALLPHVFLHDAIGRRVESAKVGSGSVVVNSATYIDSGLPNSRTRVAMLDGLLHKTETSFDFAGRKYLVQRPGADFATPPNASSPHGAHSTFVAYDDLSQVSDVYDGDQGHTRLRYDGLGRLAIRELLTRQDAISTYNTKDILNRDVLGRVTNARSFGASNGGAPVGGALNNNSPVVEQVASYDSLGRLKSESSQYPFTTNVHSLASSYAGLDGFRTKLTYTDGLTGTASQPFELTYAPDALRRIDSIDWERGSIGGAGTVLPLADYVWRGGARVSRTVHYGASAVQATGETTFDYDELGRLTLIKDDVTTTGTSPTTTETNKFEYFYDVANNLKREKYSKVGGWHGDKFVYDEFHRLHQAHIGVDSAAINSAADPNTMAPFNSSTGDHRYTYQLDAAQNREALAVDNANGSYNFQYDVEGSSTGGPSNRYRIAHNALVEHDNRGNLIYDGNHYFRYDFLNRLQEVWKVIPVGAQQQTASSGGEEDVYAPTGGVEALEDSRKAVYDEVLNLLHRVPREHKNATFRNRLRREIVGGSVVIPAPNNGGSGGGGGGMPRFLLPTNLELKALYGYDAYNRRITKVVVGEETWFPLFDGWQQVVDAKLDLATLTSPPVRQRIYGSQLDECISYRRATQQGWESYFVQHGGQETPSRLLASNGSVTERYEYEAYGELSRFNASGAALLWDAGSGFSLAYKSGILDQESGLYYFRNRYLCTRFGRFMSRDPLGAFADELNDGNEYCYAGTRPGVIGDPLGLQGGPVLFAGLATRPYRDVSVFAGLANSGAGELISQITPAGLAKFAVETLVEECFGKITAVYHVTTALAAGDFAGAGVQVIASIPGARFARKVKDLAGFAKKKPCWRRAGGASGLSAQQARRSQDGFVNGFSGRGYHATRPEHVDSILKSKLDPSTEGRLGGGGVYVNDDIDGAMAEYFRDGIDRPFPTVLEVNYDTFGNVRIKTPSSPTQGRIAPEWAPSVSTESVRMPGTTNTIIRNGTATVTGVAREF